ncbi:DUF4288 domain-containing protein [Endozoicomonas sp. G2_1]|uniref:DUF4288 domain-containing protein n=1 Tax=Endozoicomonas sp. G2_1 TaxID=2821091 RepID=UPI001ADB4464|nr:DUF4288 domain-containing protein [Endozoicomonas sp. G2_1]MBO9491017.1 DUF4288 domain-containing protein [Endozoicomonas sp. G2_1]
MSKERYWVAVMVERFQYDDEDISNPKRRCRAFTNTVLLKAVDKEQAYQKAIEYGELGIENESNWSNDKGRKGRWIFEGLINLLDVDESVIDPDGTELFFDDDCGISVGKVQSWVRKKEDLEVFRVRE